MTYIDATYPDLRKCLNLLQSNSITGKLASPKTADNSVQDYKLDAVSLFRQKQFRRARELICSQVRPDEMEEFFRWSYDNLDLWSSTPEGQDQAVVVIRNAIVAHASCGDPEINLSAMLIELTNIKD